MKHYSHPVPTTAESFQLIVKTSGGHEVTVTMEYPKGQGDAAVEVMGTLSNYTPTVIGQLIESGDRSILALCTAGRQRKEHQWPRKLRARRKPSPSSLKS